MRGFCTLEFCCNRCTFLFCGVFLVCLFFCLGFFFIIVLFSQSAFRGNFHVYFLNYILHLLPVRNVKFRHFKRNNKYLHLKPSPAVRPSRLSRVWGSRAPIGWADWRGLAPRGPRPSNGKGARRPRGVGALSPPAGSGSDGAAGRAARRLAAVAVVTEPPGDVPAACEPCAGGGSGSEVPPLLQCYEGTGAGRGVCAAGGRGERGRNGEKWAARGRCVFFFFLSSVWSVWCEAKREGALTEGLRLRRCPGSEIRGWL